MSFVVVRLAKAEDIEAIERLEQEAFGSQAWSYDGLKDAFLNDHYRFLVAEEMIAKKDGEVQTSVVGYMGAYLVVNEANVTNIAVASAYRRRGIGRQLLQKMQNLAKNSNCIAMTLEVRASNQTAIALYEQCGFVSIGVRKNFYSDPVEDAKIMWCHFVRG